MTNLFNDGWEFAELALDYSVMEKDGKVVLLNPEDYKSLAEKQDYKKVRIPHDWMIGHVKELYKNSIGFYKKSFELDDVENKHISVRFEGVYMNSAVWVNNKLAGIWKYGYATFEFDISNLVQKGKNEIQVVAVYQCPNTRWYSGAGIFRDVMLNVTETTFLAPDGTYFHAEKSSDGNLWNVKFSAEVCGTLNGHTLKNSITDKNGQVIAESIFALSPVPLTEEESSYLHENIPALGTYALSRACEEFSVENPELWDIENPVLYKMTTELFDKNGQKIDSFEQNIGFKTAVFDKDKGFFLNGRHVKIYGACQHHDHGCLGAAFDKNALRRQFNKLKEMGVNSVRCSHNPPPRAWMDLADEMGMLIDDESFDMWEKPKTNYDYGNYFVKWHEKDTISWVRKDRNHPCLIMWSIGNEIYDTHVGNGFEITKDLYKIVEKHDPYKNGEITIASNYMMTEGAEHCATEIDTVGYNYLERLYDEHHKKHPDWKIYGSETGSTVQSRGIYHFPESLKLVTFSDGQCSTLGNCTTTWGCANTQTVIANDRDCPFSAGQYIWTAWDYIGEPTPYHTKNSFFGQIDTAGFAKDTFYLYKSEWAYKNTAPFVHLLPYWDWNIGQKIDVKAYTNAERVELFFNGKSLGLQKINHKDGKEPFGRWQLAYQKGEITAVGYDENGKEIARDTKKSFTDPASIIMHGEEADTGNLFFVDLMTADKDGILVENARNYITVNVSGNAELVGMDNGDSTDFDEYVPADGKTHSRKLFANRLLAVIRASKNAPDASFTVTAASKDLPCTALKYQNGKWEKVAPETELKAEKDFVPARKIELSYKGSLELTKSNPEIKVCAKVLPKNATIKEIYWNPVLKECVASDNILVEKLDGDGTGTENSAIKAVGDGNCILRCTAKNGTNYDEVISDLNFTVSGIGNPKLNPYKLIEACRLNNWDQDRTRPVVSLESGISNRNIGPMWISFDKVDFGNEGADTIHLPVFSFDTELPLEVWDGTPANGTTRNDGGKPGETGKCLGKFTYKHASIYNTYSENVFTLNRRLFGVHTISIVIPYELVFHGFYFDKTPKAFAKLWALDANDIVGDTFHKTEIAVEGIGNNVNLDFANMNFADKKATKLTICGKSNTENNTINVKFFCEDGKNSTQVIEFAHTDDYEEKTFDIVEISGNQKISFVFLPGCNFDFKWFKFE